MSTEAQTMHSTILIASAAVALGTFGILGHMLWLAVSGDNSAAMLSDDERRRHTPWGLFYMNPNDPRGWVRKTMMYGYTVNFRHRKHIVVFVLSLTWVTIAAGVMVVAAMLGPG